MIATDENSLICDFAETYRIYDFRSLPAQLAATYAAGLRDDSRIKIKLGGGKASNEIILLSAITDRLGIIIAALTDGKVPPSIVATISGEEKAEKKDFRTFASGKDFEAARARLLRR